MYIVVLDLSSANYLMAWQIIAHSSFFFYSSLEVWCVCVCGHRSLVIGLRHVLLNGEFFFIARSNINEL